MLSCYPVVIIWCILVFMQVGLHEVPPPCDVLQRCGRLGIHAVPPTERGADARSQHRSHAVLPPATCLLGIHAVPPTARAADAVPLPVVLTPEIFSACEEIKQHV